MTIPTVTAGEPAAAGVGLVTIGAISGMHVFSAFGGALIGAGILIAVVHNQLVNAAARIRRFLVSALSGPVITLAGLEVAHHYGLNPGPYVISFIAMLLAFLAWALFTTLHNRSNRIAARAIDEAIDMISRGRGNGGQNDILDSCYIDSGRARELLARIEADQARRAKTNTQDPGGDNPGKT